MYSKDEINLWYKTQGEYKTYDGGHWENKMI